MGEAGETYSDYSNLIIKTGKHTIVSVTRVTSIMIPLQVSIHLGKKMGKDALTFYFADIKESSHL